MAASILYRGLQSLCGRENSVHQHSVLLRNELQQTYEQIQAVLEFV